MVIVTIYPVRGAGGSLGDYRGAWKSFERHKASWNRNSATHNAACGLLIS